MGNVKVLATRRAPMRVSELIEELQTLDPDAFVFANAIPVLSVEKKNGEIHLSMQLPRGLYGGTAS